MLSKWLSTAVLLTFTLLRVTQTAGEEPKRFEGWGILEDPTGGSSVDLANGVLTMTVPASYIDNYPKGVVNAPRVVRELDGDFELRVNVEHIDEAKEKSVLKALGKFPTAYHAATLLVRLDDQTFLRLERVCKNSGDGAMSIIAFQVFEKKESVSNKSAPVEADFVQLSLLRRGRQLISRYRADDTAAWIELASYESEALSKLVKVGVSMTSNTDHGCTVKFSNLQVLVDAAPGEKR